MVLGLSDNDGWLDILVCGYEFGMHPWQAYAAAEALHLPVGNAGKQFLFRNNLTELLQM